VRSTMTCAFSALACAVLFAFSGTCQVQTSPPVQNPVTTPGTRTPSTVPRTTTRPPNVAIQPATAPAGPAAAPPPLRGFVDLHTHPLSSLGFGGKLMYGGVDGFLDAQRNPQGTLLPEDPACQPNVRAKSMEQALGHERSTHGGPVIGDLAHPNFNPCGNAARALIIHGIQLALGKDFEEDSCGLPYPTLGEPTNPTSGEPTFCHDVPFSDWPTWDDVTHQKMWVDWIMRAYAGGLRVMVALAVNNRLLGDVVTVGNLSSTNRDLQTDDKATADLQIDEINRFVSSHSDWMQVARSSQDVFNIVSSNRLAVVIGVEIDQIGDFDPSSPPIDKQIRDEIDRLYGKGVRYIFPIHVVDNVFGGTAAYEDLFDVANSYEVLAPWRLTCANNPQTDGLIKYQFAGNIGKWGADVAAAVAAGLRKRGAQTPQVDPSCGNLGQKNTLGISRAGWIAIQQMMSHGMLIDIDHMSQQAVDEMLAFASRPDVRYPLMSGHNAVRGDMLHPGEVPTERNFREDQYETLGALHGMAGVGNVKRDAWEWLGAYSHVINAMYKGAVKAGFYDFVSAGFGTDTDGLEPGSPPPVGHLPVTYYQPTRNDYLYGGCSGSSTTGLKGCVLAQMTSLPVLPISTYFHADSTLGAANSTQEKTWDYNVVGFAHYGLLPDYLRDARNLPTVVAGDIAGTGAALVDGSVLNGADYFFHTWQIAENRSRCVLTAACINAPASPASKIVPSGIVNPAVRPNVTSSVGGTPAQATVLTVSVCLTSDGRTCLTPNVPLPPMGQARRAIVIVSSGGRGVVGAAVSVSGQNVGGPTNPSGVAIVNYKGCVSSTRSPVGMPVAIPAPCQGAAVKSGYQSATFGLP
jgi:microsomal dipeptidase-like Zn-dependent dipeptidase